MQFGMNAETVLIAVSLVLFLVLCFIIIFFIRELLFDENAERLEAIKKNDKEEEERKPAELLEAPCLPPHFMEVAASVVIQKPKEELEKPKVSSREKLNITRRGVDATRITVVSIRENWSDGSAKDYTCVQKCVSGPWFDATTGELLQNNNPVIKFLDYLVNSYDKELLEEQEPSPEDIFRGIVESLQIPKGLPYGQSVKPKQLPKSDD